MSASDGGKKGPEDNNLDRGEGNKSVNAPLTPLHFKFGDERGEKGLGRTAKEPRHVIISAPILHTWREAFILITGEKREREREIEREREGRERRQVRGTEKGKGAKDTTATHFP